MFKKPNMSLRKWQETYANGGFNNLNADTIKAAGWYKWVCKDTSLSSHFAKMAKIVAQLKESSKINLDELYVCFENAKTGTNPMFDIISLHSIARSSISVNYPEDMEYIIGIDSPYDIKKYNAKYAVYSRQTKFIKPVFTCNDSRELVAWFNDSSELVAWFKNK